MSERFPSTYAVLEQHGVDRRTFFKYCTSLAAIMGLEATMVPKVVAAMENKPRIPVIWLHGLECTCCSESFIRSSHPIAQDVVLNMISLDYDDTLQAAAGYQVEEIRKKIMKDYTGEYLLAVEGNAPTKDGGVYCTVGGETFLNILKETAEDAKAIVAWGSCASNGCVQAAQAQSHRRQAGPQDASRTKPIINVPGCPPIAEVMTGVLTYILTFDQLAGTGPHRPPQDVLRPAHPRQVLPAPVLRRRPVRRELGRRGRAQGLVPLQDGLPRADDVQLLLHGQVERRRLVPDRFRPRLHRLQRRELLGQRSVLPTAADYPGAGHRIHARPDRQDAGAVTGAGVRRAPGVRLGATRAERGKPADREHAGEEE